MSVDMKATQDVILADNEYITVKYVPEHQFIEHIIHKPVGGQTLRDALMAGTEGLRKYRASKWLSDDRKNGPLSQEDTEWGMENWNLPTIQAGWKYWALVVPTEVVAAGSMIPAMNGFYALGLRMMVFDNLDDAIAWLDSL